jgi:hypothetical protein
VDKQRPADAKKRDEHTTYTPTQREQTAIRKYIAHREAGAPPRVKLQTKDKVPTLSFDHSDQVVGQILLMDALGTADSDFTYGLLSQLANASSDRGVSESGLNFMLSVIKGIQPKDQLEAMLAAQMAAVHMAMMTFTRRLAHVENIPQQDSAERALNKLARTYATQMETLKRYRTGGEQKVTVQHVSVSEGGQAIVGNVTHARPQPDPAQTAKPLAAITQAQQASMAILSDSESATITTRRIPKK